MSKVSIIVPCYNVAEYLPRCLDALLAQTCQDWEAVCVDDGSTDNTYDILKQYAEKDKRIIAIHQDNHGVEWARATAMEQIDSPYVMFCDPDDWYEPEMCEKMITTLERENVDIVMCDTNIVGNANDLGHSKYLKMPNKGKYSASLESIIKINMMLWNRIYKKEIIDKYNIRFPKDANIKRGYDIYFNACYAMCIKNIYFLDAKLYNYWQRDDSLMHSINKKTSKLYFDNWYGMSPFLQFSNINGFYDTNKKVFLGWINSRIPYLLSLFKDNCILSRSFEIVCEIFEPYKKDISRDYDKLYLILSGRGWDLIYKTERTKIKICGLPLLKIIKRDNKTKYYFCGIPLMTKKKKKHTVYKVLGIPVVKIKKS